MPITTTWYDDDHTIVIHTITGAWSIREMIDELKTCPHQLGITEETMPTYFIVDLRRAHTIPKSILDLRSEYEPLISAESVTVTVGASRVLSVTFDIVRRFGFEMENHFIDSLAEAEAIIVELRGKQSSSQHP